MCGIVGGFGSLCKKEDILNGLELLRHRGKDEQFFTQCGSDGFLGMNRLSIQDTQPGLYPFKYEDCELIFNGELYNLLELRTHLLQKGIACKTLCDAEVILPLFHLYGAQAFNLLDGMFAIAIYNKRTSTLTLARDLFGEKPLYYAQKKGSSFFSSELQALPRFLHNVNERVIPEYLTFGFLNQDRTFFSEVHKVMPGECVELSLGEETKTQFGQLSEHLSSSLGRLDSSDLIKELDKRLNSVISKKLTGESPIGLFLSGGLDSSLIAALAQKHTKKPLFTYSIGFENQEDDESDAALQVAAQLKTTHARLLFSQNNVARIWEKLQAQGDEPFSDPACLPTYMLAEAAKKDVKVILTGEGADEIFGGYKRYRNFVLSSRIQSQTVTHFLKSKSFTSLNFYKVFATEKEIYSPVSYSSLWKNPKNRQSYSEQLESVWQETARAESLFSQLPVPENLQLHDLRHYVAEQLCMKTDKVLMQNDIESRAPFLDKTLLAFLPLSGREIAEHPTSNENKRLLRAVAEKYLPDEIAHRPKHGFSLPLSDLLQSSMRDEVNALKSIDSRIIQYIDQTTITQTILAFEAGDQKLKNDVWNLVTLNAWLGQH